MVWSIKVVISSSYSGAISNLFFQPNSNIQVHSYILQSSTLMLPVILLSILAVKFTIIFSYISTRLSESIELSSVYGILIVIVIFFGTATCARILIPKK